MEHISRDDVRNLKTAWNSMTFQGTATTNSPNTTITFTQPQPMTISASDDIDVLISIINQLIDEVNKKADKK